MLKSKTGIQKSVLVTTPLMRHFKERGEKGGIKALGEEGGKRSEENVKPLSHPKCVLCPLHFVAMT